MAELLTCWRKEGVLVNSPPSPGRLGKMLGSGEARNEVGTVWGGFGAKGRVAASCRLGASRSGGPAADPGKEPARGCTWAVGWARSPAPTLGRLNRPAAPVNVSLSSLLLPLPSSSRGPHPQAGDGCRDWGPKWVPRRCRAWRRSGRRLSSVRSWARF